MDIIESLKDRIAQFSAHGIRGRAIAFGIAASFVPLMVLFSATAHLATPVRYAAVIALVLSITALIYLIRSLRPVSDLAELLDQLAGGESHDGRVLDHHNRLIANAQALAERMQSEEERSRVHPVTGLAVRDQLRAAIAAQLRGRGDAPALLGLIRIANLDQLAAFDPSAANRLLAGVAHNLAAATGPARPLAHVDRDCFGIWFDCKRDVKSAAAELQALAYVLVQEQRIGSFSVTPDIQIGSALYPIDADDPDNLINRAFVSLARPQRTSDGAIAFFARPSHQEARQRFLLEQDLRQAIRRGELAMHYQPIVDLAMGRVAGAEALLRWRNGEQASPSEIIKVLEEIGLVHEIGLWTLNTACRQLRAWREQGLGDLKVAVNLSAQQLHDASLPAALKRTLATHGLSPTQIELELTETAAMEDAARTLALFQELREAGFSLAIDDFGSGYSSLAYLRRLPFQKLKIDREFVTHVDERAGSRTICKALIDLTAGLELSVLAEGVERIEEIETLRSLGCSTFQGYYFSKPLPAEQFFTAVTDPDWLARISSRVHRERDALRRRLS